MNEIRILSETELKKEIFDKVKELILNLENDPLTHNHIVAIEVVTQLYVTFLKGLATSRIVEEKDFVEIMAKVNRKVLKGFKGGDGDCNGNSRNSE